MRQKNNESASSAGKGSETNPAGEESLKVYVPTPVVRPEHAENSFTRMIEQQTAKIPSDLFLFTAIGAMGASLVFELVGNDRKSRFVGMWAPTLLILGVYNKLVKTLAPR